jgi:hypothetical protein
MCILFAACAYGNATLLIPLEIFKTLLTSTADVYLLQYIYCLFLYRNSERNLFGPTSFSPSFVLGSWLYPARSFKFLPLYENTTPHLTPERLRCIPTLLKVLRSRIFDVDVQEPRDT